MASADAARAESLDTAQEFSANAPIAPGRCHFNGLDITDHSARTLSPLDDGKPGHFPVFFGNPGHGIHTADNLPHILSAKSKPRLKTRLLDCIQQVEVLRHVKTIVHNPTLIHSQRFLNPSESE